MSITMRDAFLNELYQIARDDRQVMLISNDFGAPALDKYRADLADQFIHIGIAEQNMVDVAAGLAMAGKIVYLYSIAPFLPLRCYEQLRVHLGFHSYHVTGVVVGAGYSYDLSGPTHHALEDISVMNAIPGVTLLSPADSITGAACAGFSYREPGPKYLRFDREKLPDLYPDRALDLTAGLTVLKSGRDVMLTATGIMVHRAKEVAVELAQRGIDAGIIDLYRVKPFNEEMFLDAVKSAGKVATIEEHFLSGGIGSITASIITDRSAPVALKRFGIPDRYFFESGGRQSLHKLCGLDAASITASIESWLEDA